MAITKDPGRQEVVSAKITIGFADPASDAAVAEAIFSVPAGAEIIGGYVNVTEAFDSTTSDVLDIGDGVDDDRYTATPIDLQSTGVTALDVTGYVYPSEDTIDIEWTAGSTGTATAGIVEINIQYVVENRSAFTQGTP